MDSHTARLGELIAKARSILVVTGAGISTRSGIPDYRGPQGVWNTQRPVPFQDFVSDPERRKAYWQQKLAAAEWLNAAQPNAVHAACVELERADKLVMVVTQNIDGLHTIAGTSEDFLVEVHGNARVVSCLECAERTPAQPHLERFAETGEPPRCRCGGLLKPATISFGQSLDPMSLQRSTEAATRCDLVVALGTTLSVYPAAEIPLAAARRGVSYAIVNQGPTDHDSSPLVTVRIDGDVAEVFPMAVGAALSRESVA